MLDDQQTFLFGEDLPDHGSRNPLPSVSPQQAWNGIWGGDHEQRAGGDQGQGIKGQRPAEGQRFRQDRNFILPHAQSYSTRRSNLRQAGEQAAFGRIVHGVDIR